MADEAKGAATETKGGAERATNCTSCNKRLSRKKQYYRNGGYYCNKRCWKEAADKAAAKAAKKPEDQTAVA